MCASSSLCFSRSLSLSLYLPLMHNVWSTVYNVHATQGPDARGGLGISIHKCMDQLRMK